MADYDNTNSGVVFPNDRKQKSSHPDFKGQCTIKTPDGELVEYWVSGWEKEGRKGPFLSLSFQIKEEKKEDAEERPVQKKTSLFGNKQAAPKAASKASEPELDDDVPF